MNNHRNKFFFWVESLSNSDSVSTYKNAGLSIHILVSTYIQFGHMGKRMFSILWWHYCYLYNFLIKRKTDDRTFLIYGAIFKLEKYITFILVMQYAWL